MKPILFNTEMVRAILDGRKTMTRRLIKPQPVCYGPNKAFAAHDGDFFLSAEKKHLRCRVCGHDPEYSREGSNIVHHWKPPYLPGDILYVRETWTELFYVDPEGYTHFDQSMYYYAADGTPDITLVDGDGFEMDDQRIKWKPSIHMPKELARIFLRVKSIRVERLQAITDEDAIREGIVRMFDHLSDAEYAEWGNKTAKGKAKTDWGWNNYLWHGDFGSCGTGNRKSDAWPYQSSGYDAPRDSFSSLWNLTVDLKDWDTYGWEANPWVWVISFERCEKPEEVSGC